MLMCFFPVRIYLFRLTFQGGKEAGKERREGRQTGWSVKGNTVQSPDDSGSENSPKFTKRTALTLPFI